MTGETAEPSAAGDVGGTGEQLQLVRAKVRSTRPRPPTPPAERLPVARIAVDVPLAHLDRPFDYLVPANLDQQAKPGVRVRVRFAGKLVDGYLLERVEASQHGGRLLPIQKVVSAEPVLAPEVAQAARAVADRYAGTLADVLRLAIPPRHAATEAETPATAPPGPPPPEPGGWADYPSGPGFLTALATGSAPRAVWNALPGADWPDLLARAVQATLASGRGALVVVPDGRDVDRVAAAYQQRLGGDSEEPDQADRYAVLVSEAGPAKRYRRWLAVRRGSARAVVGTRGAMFAPVADLGLVAVWDDGDDLHAEPRAPYPHVREVLGIRAHLTGAAALIGGFARTAEAQWLLDSGWARPLTADRATVRAAAPRVQPTGDDAELARDPAARTARLPSLAWRTARQGLEHGPVLVQVPRRGYLPALACERCRQPARCSHCAGPLALTDRQTIPDCRWCGRSAGSWCCPEWAWNRWRGQVVGVRRTAEELGRAFPAVPVRTSGRDGIIARVGPEPALVLATPGAEPVAEDGYAAALLLDGWALLARPDLRAGEETVRRWLNAAALVRPAARGGSVVVLAEAGQPPVQALVRWDPAGFAERELADRAALGFPPAARMASLRGVRRAVDEFLAQLGDQLPAGTQVIGPVPVAGTDPGAEPQERALLRVERSATGALATAVRAVLGSRSARKAADPVRVEFDPLEVG